MQSKLTYGEKEKENIGIHLITLPPCKVVTIDIPEFSPYYAM